MERTTNLTLTTATPTFVSSYNNSGGDTASLDVDLSGGLILPTTAGMLVVSFYFDLVSGFSGTISISPSFDLTPSPFQSAVAVTSADAGNNNMFISGLVYTSGSSGGDTGIGMTVTQFSGSDKTLNNARLMVAKLT